MSATGQTGHPGEEEFERYSLRASTEVESAAFEEHLLLCEGCRRRLDETDQFVQAMAAAARAARREERESRVIPFRSRFAWAIAAGIAVLGAVLLYREVPGFAPLPAVHVALEATRGPLSPAPANRPLQLRPDLSGLAVFDRYTVEVVDFRNTVVWQGGLAARDPRAMLPRRGPGIYFVRIYSPARELLREYGLEVRN